MKQAKIGDVYAFKTERGYRIVQWGYFIEKQGSFVLIFPDFYKEIPSNIEAIISMDNDSLRGVSVAGGVGTGIDVHTVVGETKTIAKTTFKDVAKTILKVAKWFRKR